MTSEELLKRLRDVSESLTNNNKVHLLSMADQMVTVEQNLKASQSEQQPPTHTITNHYGANRGSEFERAYI